MRKIWLLLQDKKQLFLFVLANFIVLVSVFTTNRVLSTMATAERYYDFYVQLLNGRWVNHALPLGHFIIFSFSKIFNLGFIYSVKYLFLLVPMLLFILTYYLSKGLHNSWKYGILSATALVFYPDNLWIIRKGMLTDFMGNVFMLFTILFIYKAIKTHKNRYIVLFTFFTVCTMFTDILPSYLLFIFMFCFLLKNFKSLRNASRNCLIALTTLTIVFLLLILLGALSRFVLHYPFPILFGYGKITYPLFYRDLLSLHSKIKSLGYSTFLVWGLATFVTLYSFFKLLKDKTTDTDKKNFLYSLAITGLAIFASCFVLSSDAGSRVIVELHMLYPLLLPYVLKMTKNHFMTLFIPFFTIIQYFGALP